MFCITQDRLTGKWNSEYVDNGSVKYFATGKTPLESLNKLFEMVTERDETGTDAEIDGPQLVLQGGEFEPVDCD
jgi:hypothetical protein